MITSILLALSYWILGLLFALSGCCALGCVISLFLSILASFKSPMRLVAVPLWVIFSFASLGAGWLIQWIYVAMGIHSNHEMQYWFIVGTIVPGILGLGLVPKFIGLASGSSKNATPPGPGAAKV